MRLDPSKLSIGALRERVLASGRPVTPQLLARLRQDPRPGVQRLHASLQRRYARERDKRRRLEALMRFERVLWRSGVHRVAGVDEVGMGPLAGPVVAAAVVFAPESEFVDTPLAAVDDSKRLEASRRETLAKAIHATAIGVGIGLAEVEEVDRLNVYHAGLLAMRRAVEALPEAPDHLLIDARTLPGLAIPQNAFTRGDGLDFSVAAASIVAKVHRDRLMDALDARYPGYGFARHKGYATAEHQEAVLRLGRSPAHRRSFSLRREAGDGEPT